jgi:hypothetical protein
VLLAPRSANIAILHSFLDSTLSINLSSLFYFLSFFMEKNALFYFGLVLKMHPVLLWQAGQ